MLIPPTLEAGGRALGGGGKNFCGASSTDATDTRGRGTGGGGKNFCGAST